MENLSCHNNQSTQATAINNIVFEETNVINSSAKFQVFTPYGF